MDTKDRLTRRILIATVLPGIILFLALILGRMIPAKAQAPAIAAAISSAWQTECVDCPRQFASMRDRSLRFDTHGYAHIAYGGNHLYYAYQNASGWHTEVADPAPDVGTFTSLALDDAGNPHISYLDNANGDLKYARKIAGKWQTQTVDSPGLVGWYTSIALDSAERPRISYCLFILDFNNICDDLKYAAWNGSQWNIQVVDDAGNDGLYGSLALDAADVPYIAYLDYNNELSALQLAHWSGSGWVVEVVSGDVGYGGPLSLALDSSGRPHITYVDDDPVYSITELYYTHQIGASWSKEKLSGNMDQRAGQSSIVVDSDGHPHVSFVEDDVSLHYASFDGAAWNTQLVNAGGWSNSLALDPNGRAGISFRGDDHLWFAVQSGDSWQVSEVDSARTVGIGVSLAVDSQGAPHLTYYDMTNSTLTYAHQSSLGWSFQTVDTGGATYWGNDFTSLALDAADNPHVVYMLGYKTRYATWDGAAWITQTVASSGWAGSLALDGNGLPGVAYGASGATLTYAHWTGSGWDKSFISSSISGFYDLAYDNAGHPCVSFSHYASADAYTLRLACQDGGNWQVSDIDQGSEVGTDNSLVFDSSGVAHIAYGVHYPTFDLKYASGSGNNWQIETVDSANNTGWKPSLALDQAGSPWISYYDYDLHALKLAHKTGEGWVIEIVDQNGDVGSMSSLAFDRNGGPVIGYYDDSEKGVRLAQRSPLGLSKVAQPDQGLAVGDVLTYTLQLASEGRTVSLLDPLPANVEYVPGSLSTVNPPPVYDSGAHTISWQGTIPPGGLTLHFQVKLKGSAVGALTAGFFNVATLTDVNTGQIVRAAVAVNGYRSFLPLAGR